MVKIALQLKAFLENVTGLLADGEDFRYDDNERQLPELYPLLQMVSEVEVRQLRRDARQVAVC